MVDLNANYYDLIGAKGRNMIRKANRLGYSFRPYVFNDHLDEMFEINTSMKERGGIPMTHSYRVPLQPVDQRTYCLHHAQLYIGALKDGRLRAYSYLIVCGELAVVNRFIGHGGALKDGVMNGLMAKLVEVASIAGARQLNYLHVGSRTEGLTNFKRHAGFRPVEVKFVL